MENFPDPAAQDDEITADADLDLRGVMCPFNFVKTKLRLEDMADGAILTVTLDHGEPLKNVPASVEIEGHTILKIEPLESHARLWIQKHGS
jgi:tRNA 2-thiouridine synthesizing protein A